MKVLLLAPLTSSIVVMDILNAVYDKTGIYDVRVDGNPIDNYPDYDIGVSFLYTHRIPRAQVETHTWYNFHPGPLPEMRGRNLAYHAIMEDKKEFGATLHYMSAEYDTGDIIECRRFPITGSDNAGTLVAKSHAALLAMFKEYVPRVISGEQLQATPQGDGHYYRKSPIYSEIQLTDEQQRAIRAVTVKYKFTAYATIGGVEYRIIRSG